MALRPATFEEKRVLAGLARPRPAWMVVRVTWIAVMLFLTILGLYYLRTGAWTVAQSLVVLLVGVGGLAGFLYRRRLFARAAAADRSSGQRDHEAGEVDGRPLLFLSGQYLDEPVATKRFPAARVTVIRAPNSGIVLSTRPDGEYLAPSSVRSCFSDREHERGRVPEDGAILQTDFDRLRRGPAPS